MGLPARPVHPQGHHGHQPGGPQQVPPAKPKTAVLEVTRSDNGDATYRLLIDNVVQKLNGSTAKWDDASPWESGTYGAAFSKLRGKYDAFLLKYPPNRSEIKFHLGTETGHSEGCIVTQNANILEIEKVLADNSIPKNALKFDVKGDFPIYFKLSASRNVREVNRGGTLTLTLELIGGGAPGGVSKDVWFHIVADKLDGNEFTLVHAEKVPPYVSISSYSDTKKGVIVRLPKGDRSHDYEIRLSPPHAALVHHGQLPAAHPGQRPAAARLPAPAAAPVAARAVDLKVIFSIDNYKILNKAPGPAPYFYTPSNYKMILDRSQKTGEITVKPAPQAPHH